MRQHESQGDLIKTFHSHEFGMDLNVINRESFSNFDRWNLISMIARTFGYDRQDLFDKEQQKILIKDLTCAQGFNFELRDPSIFGFLEVLNLTQYDLNTITLWNVWGALRDLARGDAIGIYDIPSGLNKILKSSIRPGGLDSIEKFLIECKLGSLREISKQAPSYLIDGSEKYNKSGKVYQNVVSLVSEDKTEMDSDYAFYEFELDNLYISSSIESCYRNLSESCNIAKNIHGIGPDEEDHYGAVIDFLYISCNGESVIEFHPKRHINIYKEKDVALRDHQFNSVFTGENPDLIKTIMSTNDAFHRKIRGKILENDLGM